MKLCTNQVILLKSTSNVSWNEVCKLILYPHKVATDPRFLENALNLKESAHQNPGNTLEFWPKTFEKPLNFITISISAIHNEKLFMHQCKCLWKMLIYRIGTNDSNKRTTDHCSWW